MANEKIGVLVYFTAGFTRNVRFRDMPTTGIEAVNDKCSGVISDKRKQLKDPLTA